MKRVFITFFIVILLDQILKVYVKLNFFEGIGAGYDIIPGVLELAFVENPGMAFGLELPGDYGKVILTVFRMIAAVVIFWYIKKLIDQKAHKGLIFCVSLIMAGAVGNIIDCAVYGMIFSESSISKLAVAFPESGSYSTFLKGNVVDMFHFVTRWPEGMPWLGGREIFPPIFNIADASISFGVILILIRQKTFFARPHVEQVEESTDIDHIEEVSPNEESIALEGNSNDAKE